MKARITINNIIGIFDGNDDDEIKDAYAVDAGYKSYADLLEQIPDSENYGDEIKIEYFDLDNLNLASHSMEEIEQALINFETIWVLDTGNAGEDDTLIGGTYEEALQDVLCFHELDELPKNWSIEKFNM